jgi:hypothetical protein
MRLADTRLVNAEMLIPILAPRAIRLVDATGKIAPKMPKIEIIIYSDKIDEPNLVKAAVIYGHHDSGPKNRFIYTTERSENMVLALEKLLAVTASLIHHEFFLRYGTEGEHRDRVGGGYYENRRSSYQIVQEDVTWWGRKMTPHVTSNPKLENTCGFNDPDCDPTLAPLQFDGEGSYLHVMGGKPRGLATAPNSGIGHFPGYIGTPPSSASSNNFCFSNFGNQTVRESVGVEEFLKGVGKIHTAKLHD